VNFPPRAEALKAKSSRAIFVAIRARDVVVVERFGFEIPDPIRVR